MRSPPFSLFALNGFFRTGLRSLLVDLFRLTSRHDDVRNLPTYLLRDIGLDERRNPDWPQLLL
jgi:hypothetical protein